MVTAAATAAQPPAVRRDWGRRGVWIAPAVLAGVVTGYLSWGAWVSAHHPEAFFRSHLWLHTWLRPGNDWLLFLTGGLWLAALLCFWWPRRLRDVGLPIVVAMMAVGAVLGIAAMGQCREGQAPLAVSSWILQLYVGQLEPVYGQATSCPGALPLALQIARTICLAATFVGATAAAAVLWRQPLSRMRARLVRDATVLTGLDSMTLPLLQVLTQTRRPRSVVLIEPNENHPLLEEARSTEARIMIADPMSVRTLRPVIEGWRGCALSYLYALREDAADNEAVLAAARAVLEKYGPDPKRQPHLVARIDDPRHADHWRGRHAGTAGRWFEDALSPQEATARALVSQILKLGARQILLCGDSTLGLAILLELAHRAWERHGLAEAEARGRAAANGGRATGNGGAAGNDGGAGGASRPLQPVQRVLLIDQRAEDLRREYLATSPWMSVPGVLPEVGIKPAPWRDELLGTVDAMKPGEAAATAVVVTVPMTDSGMHIAGRMARLHPETAVFVLSSDGAGIRGAIFDQLRPFQRGVLVSGGPPEDTWTRLARHWHECYRLANPLPAGDPREPNRRPWAQLDEFIRQDNILQLRNILVTVASLGREWVPVRAVPKGSFVELTGSDLAAVARAEHNRWYLRRRQAGWRPTAQEARSPALVNSIVVPWEERPERSQVEHAAYIGTLVEQLEDAGFMPVVPAGGPPGTAEFVRAGAVRARRLSARRLWTRQNGDELRADEGDWRVIDEGGDDRTVRDEEFRASHTYLSGDRWRRTGVFRAWQVSEQTVVRTLEGKSTAEAGDWIVQGPTGVRWPVPDRQFQRTYQHGPAGDSPA
jgi:hypothetical protein